MRLKDIIIGKKYRITYKRTRSREIHWRNNLIPQPGTIVIVANIRDSVYAYPIIIFDNDGIVKHCIASDLIKYEGENYR